MRRMCHNKFCNSLAISYALQHNNDVIYRTNPVFVFNLLLIPYN